MPCCQRRINLCFKILSIFVNQILLFMELTIRIDQRKKEARALLEFLKNLPFVELDEKPRYNSETEKAIQKARLGKTTPLNLDDFRKQLYS